MRVHFIAIGGSAMHALAIALHNNDYTISGSDDEIYNPARDNLKKYDILPTEEGWFPERIDTSIDFIILGMHAKKDNPELLKAQSLGLEIYSYPAFIAKISENKKRVVIAGSHGKTTTTALVLHVLDTLKIKTDYLVGAQLPGYDSMVKISDAPLIVLEGDEYLSSPIDRRPKIMHYKPDIAVITGIAWDHINVFPTFEDYCHQFELFVGTIKKGGKLFYYEHDEPLQKVVATNTAINSEPYTQFDFEPSEQGSTVFLDVAGESLSHNVNLLGKHNMQNLMAAFRICTELEVAPNDFFKALQSFKGAAKRLQLLSETNTSKVFLDFAHAPSKVRATVSGIAEQFPDKKIIALLELHTFSSLNPDFLPQYKGVFEQSDASLVCYNRHTLEMKGLPDLSIDVMKGIFGESTAIFDSSKEIKGWLEKQDLSNSIILFMSSGSFGTFDVQAFAASL